MSVRVGLLGCGEHSEIGHAVPLARYSAEHPGAVALAAACDLHRERAEMFCNKFGFARAYVDLTSMLANERLDVCIAVTPVDIISETGMRLLQAGIPCVVEKPLGSSIAEVHRLLEAARASTTPNMVSVNRRFMPLLQRGIDWAKSEGSLRYLRITMLRHERTEPEFLIFTGIHAFDTARFIAGDFSSLKIQSTGSHRTRWYSVETQFESGVRGHIDILPTAGIAEEKYELAGDGFYSVITSPFGSQRVLRCYKQNRRVHEEIAENTPEDIIFGFYGEAVELIEALSQGQRPRPSIEDIVPSVQACFDVAERIEKNATQTSPG